MIHRLSWVAILTITSLAVNPGVTYSQVVLTPDQIVPAPFVPREMAPRPAATKQASGPDHILRVDYDIRVPEATAKVHAKVKDFLNKARPGALADRINFFQTVIHPDSPRVSGWRGMIQSVNPIEGGVIVDLSITAIQSGMHDSIHIVERYSIVNGKVNYMGSRVPQNQLRVQSG